MMQRPDESERVLSYAIGGSGITYGGITWAGFVQLTGELTTVIGFITALAGCVIVLLRLYRDWTCEGRKRP